MQELPADSPYRRTVEISVWTTIVDLWQRAGSQAPGASSDKLEAQAKENNDSTNSFACASGL
jgi:hypothetical protein